LNRESKYWSPLIHGYDNIDNNYKDLVLLFEKVVYIYIIISSIDV